MSGLPLPVTAQGRSDDRAFPFALGPRAPESISALCWGCELASRLCPLAHGSREFPRPDAYISTAAALVLLGFLCISAQSLSLDSNSAPVITSKVQLKLLNPACHRVIPLVGRNRPIARTSFSSQTLASTPRSHWRRSQSHRNPQFRTIFPPGKSNQNKTEVELADQLTVLPPCLGKLLQSAFVRACPPSSPCRLNYLLPLLPRLCYSPHLPCHFPLPQVIRTSSLA